MMRWFRRRRQRAIMQEVERYWVRIDTPDGTLVDGPVALLVHGGPQVIFAPGDSPRAIEFLHERNLDLRYAIGLSPGSILTMQVEYR